MLLQPPLNRGLLEHLVRQTVSVEPLRTQPHYLPSNGRFPACRGADDPDYDHATPILCWRFPRPAAARDSSLERQRGPAIFFDIF
ncbi:hypothetical protein [Roseimaritima sediminicola]|uniref:hypothetical protein n=1 Tax=Roseimaritima sediminicola TaxID=2662066 RepID=UPI001F45A9EE|nr:hypothetical protein [Roseimaritima sediminicola]